MNPKVLRITETAVMTALLVALQAVTAGLNNQFLTGSCVNAVLALTTLLVGLWSGAAVALLSPFFAFFLGIGPQLPPIIPAIAVGNVVFVVLLWALGRRRGAPPERQIAAWLVSAVGKFAALYLIVVQLLCRVLPLKQPQINTFSAMFSWPQLVTALIGGAVALLLTPLLQRALKR